MIEKLYTPDESGQTAPLNESLFPCDRETLIPIPVGRHPYRMDGCTYSIPNDEHYPCYTFGELLLTLGDTTLSSASPENKLYLPADGKEQELSLLVHDLLPMPGLETHDVGLYLYKEHEPEPLCVSWESPDDENDIFINLSRHGATLSPGRYFLLVVHADYPQDAPCRDKMGGHVRFAFTVLESGRNLSHPDILSGKIRQKSRTPERQGMMTSGHMEIKLRLNRNAETGHEYKLACYNESLWAMGKDMRYIRRTADESPLLRFTIRTERIWMHGNYFAVLFHNDEPFARIDFNWNGGSVAITSHRHIGPMTAEYMLVKPAEEYSSEWERIRELPGTTAIKWKLLEQAARNELDKLRSRYRLTRWESNMNFILTGPDNTIRKELAERIPYVLNTDLRGIKTVRAGELADSGSPTDPYEKLNALLNEKPALVCLSGLDALQFGTGHTIVQKLREAMTDEVAPLSLALSGSPAEISRLFDSAPGLEKFFPPENRWDMQTPTLHEFILTLQKRLKTFTLELSSEAQAEICARLSLTWQDNNLTEWDDKTVKNFIRTAILPGVQKRLLGLLQEGKADNKALLTTVLPQDIDYSALAGKQDTFECQLKQLNEMVGLQGIKQNLHRTFNRIRFNECRKHLGLPSEEKSSHHMIFTGNPGTGKTTVARMIGRIYHAMGLLSKGELVMTERSRIVGRYLGETEKNMLAVLEQAKGNVLFIDEAYTLYDGADDRKDFGCRAIECLLTVLSRQEPDMLVIMAGYDLEMKKMLEANQGLKGRFPNHFHFDDYSAEELMQIARNRLAKKEYLLTDDAEKRLQDFVTETVACRDRYFSNARWMEQFLEHGILSAMAERVLATCPAPDRLFYQTIVESDVEQAAEKFRHQVVPRSIPQRKIGFTA